MHNIFRIILVSLLLLVSFNSIYADEYLPADNSFIKYHDYPRYRPSEEHPVRILAYALHPIGWIARELITRPISYLASSTHETRSIFGYRDMADYRNPECFSRSNAVPDCRSIKPYDYLGSTSLFNEDTSVTAVVMEEAEVSFPNVNFDFNSRKLNAAGMMKAKEIAATLNESKGLLVVLEGHTDGVGSDAYNNVLGMDRAEAVRGALVELGVSKTRLSTVTFGETRPVADNDTSAGRASNRRVEVHPDL